MLVAAAGAAVIALVLSVIGLVWNVLSWAFGRVARNRPHVLATVIEEPADSIGAASIGFVNAGEGLARFVLFLAATPDKLVQGGVGDGVLLPHAQTVTELPIKLPVNTDEDIPLVWTYMDRRGNIYARSNHRRRVKRYKSKKRRELGAIFRDFYPDATVPDDFATVRPSRWIGD
jgi:hypothetical protein